MKVKVFTKISSDFELLSADINGWLINNPMITVHFTNQSMASSEGEYKEIVYTIMYSE